MVKKFSIHRIESLFRLMIGIIISGMFLSSEITYAIVKNPEGLGFESSNLAIVIINTNGQTITSSARIPASMGIINNSAGNLNFLTDPFTDYNGQIEIEIRGHSSKGFDQKSYRIETSDPSGITYNVPLLGMPKDNDWVLYGPYCDKSLIRNALVYSLAGEINAYAPRTRFCELILNNGYQGVYLLIEKIKQDKNRINIMQMNPVDINEPGVSGGYMFKKELSSDKGDNVIALNSGLNLSVIEPRPEDIASGQTKWLKDYLNNFESALYNNTGDYTTYIDVTSVVDNFLMVEFFKNVDGFRASTYFYKDRNAKIVAGPVWDYNLSLGNADYNYGWTAERWYHEDENSWSFYWFDELLSRAGFWDQIKTRWAELRGSIIEYNHINLLIDNMVSELEEAQVRHFTKWTILGKYTWPNPGYPVSGEWGFPSPTSGAPTTWNGEINYVKDFVKNRLVWMDAKLDYQSNNVYTIASNSAIIQAYPNPCSSLTKIKYTLNQPGKVLLKIYNIKGQEIKTLQNEFLKSGEFSTALDTQNFENGVYIVRLQIDDRVETLKLIVEN